MDIRYRSMDTLRAIAILTVLLAHSVLSYGAPSYLAPLQFGGTGVDLFFVLSGWLLGSQLFKEINRDKSIDIKRFWVRRWMRTLPAYYAVLIFSVTQRLLTKDNVSFPFEYFFFIQNYNHPLEFFSISWSLCVEEQFYLVIAPLLAGLALLGKKQTTGVLLILLILPFTFRQLDLYGNVEETHVRFDGCIMGVLLAQIHYQYEKTWSRIIRYAPIIFLISITLYFLFYVRRYVPATWLAEPGQLFLVFVFAGMVIAANSSEDWRAKFYFPGANYIATRSYAIYLLHPEVLALEKKFLLDANFILYFAVAFIGSCIFAEILFRIVEKPFMDIREKFTVSKAKHFYHS